MILKLLLDLPEHQSYVRITRLLGRTLLEYLGVIVKDIDDIEMVVGELCANVVRHSRSSDRRFQMTLEYYADRISIVVEDRGTGFSFKDVPEVGTRRADFEGADRIGGFGLELVRLLSDHLEFHRTDPQGTTVRAEKRLNYITQAAADEAVHLSKSGGGGQVVMGASCGRDV